MGDHWAEYEADAAEQREQMIEEDLAELKELRKEVRELKKALKMIKTHCNGIGHYPMGVVASIVDDALALKVEGTDEKCPF